MSAAAAACCAAPRCVASAARWACRRACVARDARPRRAALGLPSAARRARAAPRCRGARQAGRRRRRLPPRAPAAPGRISLLVAVAMPAAGFVVPDALLEREARRRRRRLLAALPDALDLLAVGSASGRSPAAGFAEIARGRRAARWPRSCGSTVAELACGRPLGRGARGAARARPRQRDRDPLRLDRALAPLRLAARRPAAPPGHRPAPRPAPRGRGARRPRRAEDPARRRPRPRPLGPADDRRRPDRQRRRPARAAF